MIYHISSFTHTHDTPRNLALGLRRTPLMKCNWRIKKPPGRIPGLRSPCGLLFPFGGHRRTAAPGGGGRAGAAPSAGGARRHRQVRTHVHGTWACRSNPSSKAARRSQKRRALDPHFAALHGCAMKGRASTAVFGFVRRVIHRPPLRGQRPRALPGPLVVYKRTGAHHAHMQMAGAHSHMTNVSIHT